MGRKCSHCRNIGHNSRTCTNTTSTSKNNNGGTNFMLFGVPLDISNPSIPIKKTLSFESSSSSSASSSSSSSSPILSPSVINPHTSKAPLSYLSDSRDLERNKGVAWSEEEHRMFLIGLEKLGKGDWRGISKNFVMSRTPTQVASHAQKYFLRQACGISKVSRRRSSLFDAVGSCRSDCHGLLSISADSKDGLDLYQSSSRTEHHCGQHSAYSDKTLSWTTYDQPSCTENKMDDAQPELELGLSSPLADRLG